MDHRTKICLSLVLSLMIVIISFILSDKIRGKSLDEAHIYNTAVIIDDTNLLSYAMETNQGNVITGGTFNAVTPVKFSEMKGGYIRVERTTQEYRMHTRTVTDSNGITRTEVYWTWDNVGWDTLSSPKVRLRDSEYPSGTFKFRTTNLSGYHYVHSKKRYDYDVVYDNHFGNFIAKAYGGTLQSAFGGRIDVMNKSYQEVKDFGEKMLMYRIIMFWIISFIVNAIMSYGLYFYLNKDEIAEGIRQRRFNRLRNRRR